MSSALFEVLRVLEGGHVHDTLERTRPDTVRVIATQVGERLEIEVFEDDHVETSRLRGNEDVEGDLSLLAAILKDEAAPPGLSSSRLNLALCQWTDKPAPNTDRPDHPPAAAWENLQAAAIGRRAINHGLESRV